MKTYRQNSIFLLFTFLSSVAFERALFVLYLSELGYSAWHISTLQIVLFLSSLLAEVPTGVLADRIGRRAALQIGTLLMGLSVYGQYWAAGRFLPMLIAFALHGISFAFISGSALALLYDNLKAANKDSTYLQVSGAGRLLTSLALSFSMAAGGFLKLQSWHSVYVASFAFLVIAAVLLFLVPEARYAQASTPINGLGLRQLGREAKSLLPVILPFSLMHAAMTPYFIYSQKVLEALKVETTGISTVVAGSEILGATITLGLVGLKTRWRVWNVAPALLIAFGICLALNCWKMKWISVTAFLISAAIVLFLQSLALDYIQGDIKESRLRASVLSIVSFFDAIAICAAYLLYGFLFDRFEPGDAVAMTTVLPIVAAGWLALNSKRRAS